MPGTTKQLKTALTRLSDLEYTSRVEHTRLRTDNVTLRSELAAYTQRCTTLERQIASLNNSTLRASHDYTDGDDDSSYYEDDDDEFATPGRALTAQVPRSQPDNQRQLRKLQKQLAASKVASMRLEDESKAVVAHLKEQLREAQDQVRGSEVAKREKELEVDKLVQELVRLKMQYAETVLTPVKSTFASDGQGRYGTMVNGAGSGKQQELDAIDRLKRENEVEAERLLQELIATKMELAAASNELDEERKRGAAMKKRLQLYTKKVASLEAALVDTQAKLQDAERSTMFGFMKGGK